MHSSAEMPIKIYGSNRKRYSTINSMRAAEESTGHTYETNGQWLRQAGKHADAWNAILTMALGCTEHPWSWMAFLTTSLSTTSQ
jgi:hypothetical protein